MAWRRHHAGTGGLGVDGGRCQYRHQSEGPHYEPRDHVHQRGQARKERRRRAVSAGLGQLRPPPPDRRRPEQTAKAQPRLEGTGRELGPSALVQDDRRHRSDPPGRRIDRALGRRGLPAHRTRVPLQAGLPLAGPPREGARRAALRPRRAGPRGRRRRHQTRRAADHTHHATALLGRWVWRARTTRAVQGWVLLAARLVRRRRQAGRPRRVGTLPAGPPGRLVRDQGVRRQPPTPHPSRRRGEGHRRRGGPGGAGATRGALLPGGSTARCGLRLMARRPRTRRARRHRREALRRHARGQSRRRRARPRRAGRCGPEEPHPLRATRHRKDLPTERRVLRALHADRGRDGPRRGSAGGPHLVRGDRDRAGRPTGGARQGGRHPRAPVLPNEVAEQGVHVEAGSQDLGDAPGPHGGKQRDRLLRQPLRTTRLRQVRGLELVLSRWSPRRHRRAGELAAAATRTDLPRLRLRHLPPVLRLRGLHRGHPAEDGRGRGRSADAHLRAGGRGVPPRRQRRRETGRLRRHRRRRLQAARGRAGRRVRQRAPLRGVRRRDQPRQRIPRLRRAHHAHRGRQAHRRAQRDHGHVALLAPTLRRSTEPASDRHDEHGRPLRGSARHCAPPPLRVRGMRARPLRARRDRGRGCGRRDRDAAHHQPAPRGARRPRPPHRTRILHGARRR